MMHKLLPILLVAFLVVGCQTTHLDSSVSTQVNGSISSQDNRSQNDRFNVVKGQYAGEYKDGKRDGQGTYIFSNGDKYVGEFQDGQRHGQGTYTFSNGDKYVGEFKDGQRQGQGT